MNQNITENIEDVTIELECTTRKMKGFIDAKDYTISIRHNGKQYCLGIRYLYPENDIEKVLKDLLRIN